MKIKDGLILRQIADTYIVVAIGEEAKKANVMITLNETGGFLWQKLSEGATEEELLRAVLNTYDIDEATAKADVEDFVKKVKNSGLVEE
ncbi:MAG: PqqD family protein [Clostridia bacterium]|nr:PqqD family protein [Clostridia bacterium]